MAIPSYGDKLIPYCESLGALEVRRLRLQNHFHSLDWDRVDRWLAIKDAESKERADTREEESLSISRRALSTSERATRIAIIAIVLSIIIAIKEIIEWLSK